MATRQDPWTWTVDDVALHIRDQFTNDTGSFDLPAFIQALHDNEVDGASLLCEVDASTLRNPLGVTRFGPTFVLTRAIDALRAQSPIFIAHKANKTESIKDERHQKHAANDAAANYDSTQHICTIPATWANQAVSNIFLPHQSHEKHSADGTFVQDGPMKDDSTMPGSSYSPAPMLSPSTTLPARNPGSRHVKKRRIELQPGSSASKVTDSEDLYLGWQATSLEEMFFGTTQVGENIHDRDGDILDCDRDFTWLQTRHIPTGKQKMIHRRIQSFLSNDLDAIDDNRFVKRVCPDRLVKENPTVLLFKHCGDGLVELSRRNAFALDDTPYTGACNEPGEIGGRVNNEWDYLLQKYPVDSGDYVLPAYGESDYGADTSPMEGVEQAQKAKTVAPALRRLDIEQIVECVEQVISKYKSEWQAERQPIWENDAASIWREARGHARTLVISQAEHEVAYLTSRLEKLKNAICLQPWSDTRSLERQCGVLEFSVVQREVWSWKLRIWGQSRCPPNTPLPSASKCPQKNRPAPHSDDEDRTNALKRNEKPAAGCDYIQLNQLPGNVAAANRSADRFLGSVRDTESNKHLSDDSMPAIRDTKPETDFLDDPTGTSLNDVWSWALPDLVENKDTQRMIVKLLSELPSPTLVELAGFAFQKQSHFRDRLCRALNTFIGTDMLGQTNNEVVTSIKMARLYLSFKHCSLSFAHNNVDITRATVHEAVSDILLSRDCKADVDEFQDIIQSATGEGGPFESSTEIRSRRRKVPKSRRGEKEREEAHNRMRRGVLGANAMEALPHNFEWSSDIDVPPSGLIINPDAEDQQQYVHVDATLASKLEPHQIEGVRFLWREVVTAGEGCLLAHTMGLGKSLQSITLLTTLAQTARSKKRELLPEEFHLNRAENRKFLRILVLCPPGLIANWLEEFNQWWELSSRGRSHAGDIYEVQATMGENKRILTVETWYKNGGVLLLGYEMLRRLASNQSSKVRVGRTSDQYHLEDIREVLLQGPNIIIADEAHKFKNKSSGIGAVMSNFRTKSRIALTGTPLANSLSEYFSMIDWVSPGYLGEAAEFRAYFQIPIEEGFYAESTRYEIQRSRIKLQVLKDEIEPKVLRRDMTVLKDLLRSKTEFVIKLGLTPVQEEAYKAFILTITQQDNSTPDIANLSLLNYIAVLTLLCFHPSVFLNKLTARAAVLQGKRTTPLPTNDEEAAEPEDADLSPFDSAILQEQKGILQNLVQGQASTSLSGKTEIIEAIVRESKRVGDQVLIFSHFIPVLDYLEDWLKSLGKLKVARLDGETKIEDRFSMAKSFNNGEYDVFLISTRAGGLGLNLPGANRVIIVDFSFNPQFEEQAIGRAYRLGQKKAVYVYHLICGGTFEESLHQKTMFKKQLALKVVDKKNPRAVANRIRDFLFIPTAVPQGNLEPFKGSDTVLDAIISGYVGNAASSVRSLSTTDILHHETAGGALTKEELEEVERSKTANRTGRQTNSPRLVSRNLAVTPFPAAKAETVSDWVSSTNLPGSSEALSQSGGAQLFQQNSSEMATPHNRASDLPPIEAPANYAALFDELCFSNPDPPVPQ